MTFQTIGIKEVEEHLKKAGTRLIDLRSREEYRLYHIKGAMNIPYDELEKYLDTLKKDTTYILYCERGGNSLLAARELSRQGFRVYTVSGGIRTIEENRLN